MTAETVKKLCELMSTKRLLTTPYHPQTDGQTERYNQTIANMLSKYIEPAKKQKDWDSYVPLVTFAYNTSVHDATKQTPFAMLYGRQAQLPLDVALLKPASPGVSAHDYYTLVTERIAELQKAGHLNIEKAQHKMESRFPALETAPQYSKGDKVWVLHPHVPRGMTSKLTSMWKGPFVVVAKLSDLNYLVRPLGGTVLRTTHISKLKRYREGLPVTLQERSAAPEDAEGEKGADVNKPARKPKKAAAEHNSSKNVQGNTGVDMGSDNKDGKDGKTNDHVSFEKPGEDETDRDFEVEEVVGKKVKKDGTVLYKLKWRGYPLSQCTWEPEEHLSCRELVDEFEARKASGVKKSPKQRVDKKAQKKGK
jgi:hypothetical protein